MVTEPLELQPYPADHKHCSGCRVLKPEDAFFRMKRGRTAGQLSFQCRACTAMYRRQRNANGKNAAYVMKRRTESFAFRLRQKYGITIEQYDAMLHEQAGVCAICKQPERSRAAPMRRPGGTSLSTKRLAVDHNHTTGQVRALLCYHCNALVGRLEANGNQLSAALQYLDRFGWTMRGATPTILPVLSWQNWPPDGTAHSAGE